MIRCLLLLALTASLAQALDVDLRLVGWSLLPVASGQRTATGYEVLLADGSRRTIDLTYGRTLWVDDRLGHPRNLHQFWIRATNRGDRASVVCTSTPLWLLAGSCLVLDLLLLRRYLKARRRPGSRGDPPAPPRPSPPGSGRGAPAPTPAAPGSAGSAPPSS